MKLNKKLVSLLVAAVMAVMLMPVCMAAEGDSITTRVTNALNVRASADLYEEVATTTPDGNTQTMTMARSGGNAYIKMTLPDVGDLVYVLKDGQGYLLDAGSKVAIQGAAPTVKLETVEASGESGQTIPGVETRLNVNGQDYDALSYTAAREDGQNVTLSYCVEGDTLKYTVTDTPEGRTVTEFRVITTNVDQNLFNVPADYQVMTEAEWTAAH